MNDHQKIGIAVTTFNESSTIVELLDSLVTQTLQPSTIVICDAGSTDDTVTKIKRYSNKLPIQVFSAPGVNIARGRNLAIEKIATPLIAVIDGGCVAEPRWLEELYCSFTSEPNPDVVSGWYEPFGKTIKEQAFALLHKMNKSSIKPDEFLPSSRSVAFRKEAWLKAGRYPEWLTFAAEDTLFGLALRHQGSRFLFASEAVVLWRMRSSYSSLWKQYYRYGFGDAEAKLLNNIFYIKTVLVVSIFLFLFLCRSNFLWLTYGLFGAFFLLTFPVAIQSRDPRLIVLGGYGKFVTFFAQYFGFIQGKLHGKQMP